MLPLLLAALLSCAVANDVIVCGGFVRTEAPIDFSLVSVKVLGNDGTFKFGAECAPNNGYYFLPVYEKGAFKLRIDAPNGWLFDRTEVDVVIDGETDDCSKEIDINFEFLGFTLSGSIIHESSSAAGPAGVSVSLRSESSSDIITSVVSNDNGEYSLPNVLPGKYFAFASHPTLTIKKHVEIEVVAGGSLTLPPFHITGYQLQVSVICEEQPISGVEIVLLSDNQALSLECTAPSDQALTLIANDKLHALCSSKSVDGKVVFKNVPTGQYSLSAVYIGDNTVFDVLPKEIAATVSDSNVVVAETFIVRGFVVSGRVVNHDGTKGISGATVSLDSSATTITNADGSYSFTHVVSGEHTLRVAVAHLYFDDFITTITPKTPKLAPIVATAYSLCGAFLPHRLPAGIPLSGHKVVLKTAQGVNVDTVTSDASGKFCFKAAPREYVIEAVPSAVEVKAGLSLQNNPRTISISEPTFNLSFEQFVSQVVGHVQCIGACGELAVVLQSNDRQTKTSTVVDANGNFSFSEIHPGSYKVSVDHADWCWAAKSVDIVVSTSSPHDTIQLVQTGFVVTILISHDSTLLFSLKDENSAQETLETSSGKNKFCLAKPGVYEIKPKSCLIFQHDSYEFDTSNPLNINIVATHFTSRGVIVTSSPCDSVYVEVRALRSETVSKIIATTVDSFSESFEFILRQSVEESIEVTPFGCDLLFTPASITVDHSQGGCSSNLAFSGDEGLYLTGSVTPALANVNITAYTAAGVRVRSVLTNEEGLYRIGPVLESEEYVVSGSLVDHTVIAIDTPARNFVARKMASLTVRIRDANDEPVPKVLLSLTGGKFKSNSFSNEEGNYQFANLEPAEYVLRPMEEEYRFSPQIVPHTVKSGVADSITVTATRIAFSCFGVVRFLNGELASGATVEAVAADGEIRKTTTDANGAFRVRALKPGQSYTLRVASAGSSSLETSSPTEVVVKIERSDVHDVNFVVVLSSPVFNVFGIVNTPREYLKAVTVVLAKASSPNTVLRSQTLFPTEYFEFRSLPKTEEYIVRVETSLSSRAYQYTLASEKVSGSNHQVSLHFNPVSIQTETKARSSQQHPETILQLILVAIVVALVTKIELILGYANEILFGKSKRS